MMQNIVLSEFKLNMEKTLCLSPIVMRPTEQFTSEKTINFGKKFCLLARHHRLIELVFKESLQNPVLRNFYLFKSTTYERKVSEKWGFAYLS
jgi:hypothetical protein